MRPSPLSNLMRYLLMHLTARTLMSSLIPVQSQSDGVQIVKVVSATDSGSLSQSTTDNSQQSQSILQNVNQDSISVVSESIPVPDHLQQSQSVLENDSVANIGVEVSKTGPFLATDVDTMDPSLVFLKRPTWFRSGECRKKSRSSVLDPSAKGCHVGLPVVSMD